MKTHPQIVVPALSTSLAHFLLGLDVGVLVLVAYFFVPDGVFGVKKYEWLDMFTLVWALPAFFSAVAMAWAWWRPFPFLRSRGVVATLLALLIGFGALVTGISALLFFVLSRVLTGC